MVRVVGWGGVVRVGEWRLGAGSRRAGTGLLTERRGDILDEGWILGLGICSWATLGVLPVLMSLDKKVAHVNHWSIAFVISLVWPILFSNRISQASKHFAAMVG